MTQITVKDASGSDVSVARVIDTGTAAAAASMPVTLSSEDKALLVGAAAPEFSGAVIVSVTTDATGSAFVAFGSQACAALDVVNAHPSSVDIEVRRGGAGPTIPVPAGSSRLFVGIADADELQVRRIDLGLGTVTVTAEALS
jgi:hypothetical protein